jgi:hypothetical protein
MRAKSLKPLVPAKILWCVSIRRVGVRFAFCLRRILYLQVKDEAWLILREEGMVVEEPLEGSDNDIGDYDEKHALAEKIAMHVGGLPTPPISHDLSEEPGEKSEAQSGRDGTGGEYLM